MLNVSEWEITRRKLDQLLLSEQTQLNTKSSINSIPLKDYSTALFLLARESRPLLDSCPVGVLLGNFHKALLCPKDG